jgi:hypothetical protein
MKTRLFTVFTIAAIVALIVVGYQVAQAEQVLGKKRIDILNKTGVRFFVTDPTGKGLDPKLGFKAEGKRSKGAKCYLCSGTPKVCTEVDCKEVLIVETLD